MRFDYLRIGGLALLFFVPFLGGVHLFDWDEINFAECAREMLITGDFFRPQINYEFFWEKPPLFFWFQAASMKVFGVGEFAARFPNALCGVLTLIIVYHLGRRLHDRAFGWLWALAWLGSLLPHLYFRSGIIDPWFNLLIFTGIYGFIEFRWLFFTKFKGKNFWHRYRYLIFGGTLLGLAVLAKGPTAYLIVLLTLLAYWSRYRFRNKGFLKHLIIFSVTAVATASLWFGIDMLLHGPDFTFAFIDYQLRLLTTPDSGHGGFLGFHALVLLLGCFPISVFALPNLWGDRQSEDELLESDTLASCKRSDMATWMQLLFWVVLILFTVVQTKIVHYSSLAYFPLTYLGSLTIWRALRWQMRPKVVSILLPIVGIVLGAMQMAIPVIGMNIHWLDPMLADNPFLSAQLHTAVEWHWWQALPGAVLIAASLYGWSLWRKHQAWRAAQSVFTGGAIFVALTLLFCVSNIERYTQYSTIDFYESKVGEDCLVKPVGFKSYAHLFYTQKLPAHCSEVGEDYQTLTHGDPGKKIYFVAKITNLQDLPELPDCQEMYRKNGHVYFERIPE